MSLSKTILITGASSGIGRAMAKALALNNNKLILCGRNKTALFELQSEISVQSSIAVFDVRDKNTVNQAIEQLPQDFKQINVLINNAGNAHGLATIDQGEVDDWDAMIDGNVKGLLYVTKAVLPLLAHPAHIINMGSIAGKETYVNGAVYCASKFAVDALTQGMRKDLYQKGIKVSAIHPGLVETNFSKVRFKGDEDRASAVYQGYEALQAEDIAQLANYMIYAPWHVNLADVTILPTAQASATLVHKT